VSTERTALLREARTDLRAVVREALRTRLSELLAEHADLAGVALHAGDTYEFLTSPTLVWTRSSDLPDASAYHRYNPEEWPHWEPRALAAAAPLVASWNARFDALHTRDPDVYVLDVDEERHLARFHEALLGALTDLHHDGAFRTGDREVFAVLWFTQGEHDLVAASVAALNRPEVVAAYRAEFG
jgi:hypothetical protein